jgi:hypothetical protein
MKSRSDNRILAAFTACVVSCLPACERVLDVVDQLEPPGSEPSVPPDPGSQPSVPECGCASSPALLPLSCGMPPVPLYDNDVVQLTADGGVVAFNVCDEAGFNCTVLRWDGRTLPIATGLMLGVSASGQRVLSTGDGLGLSVIDVGGAGTILPLGMLPGRGSLSAAGDSVVGTQWVEADQINYLVRADVASGEIERLGAVGFGLARTYVTPSGSHIVGWGIDINDPESDYAYRWNDEEGLVIGPLPNSPANSRAWPEAISADGSVVAGRVGGSHFRYTEADGLVEIASTSGRSETTLSNDGRVVVGSLIPDGGDSAVFRWTRETGAVDLTPGVTSLAVDASDDGGVVVANSWEEAQNEGATPEHSFVWDEENGTRSLDEVLQDRGVDATGWEFGHARAISGNGKVLVGRATCGGAPTLYRIVLSD